MKLIFTPSREIRYLSRLSSLLKINLAKTIVCYSKRNEKLAMVVRRIHISLSKQKFRHVFRCKMLVTDVVENNDI